MVEGRGRRAGRVEKTCGGHAPFKLDAKLHADERLGALESCVSP